MATVTDEDREFYRSRGMHDCTPRLEDFAAYRERIEARVRAECGKDAGAWRMWAFEDACVDGPVTYSNESLRANIIKRIADLEAQLAAAKPVLTAEERTALERLRSNGLSAIRTLVGAFDRLCPPTKAPQSDAELADMLAEVYGQQGKDNATINRVVDALRARGAK